MPSIKMTGPRVSNTGRPAKDGPPKPAAMTLWLVIPTALALLVALVASSGAAFPFVAVGGLYMGMAWRQASRSHAELASARAELAAEQSISALGRRDVADLRSQLERLGAGDVVRLESIKSQIRRETADLEELLGELRSSVSAEQVELGRLRNEVVDLREMADLNDFGLYNFENPAQDSVRYGELLGRLQGSIKTVVKEKRAVTAAQDWTVNGSTKAGAKMLADMSKLLLRAYNAEAENAVKTVKAGRLAVAEKRLDRSREAVARLGNSMGIAITDQYHALRRKELSLTHAYQEAVKAAKDAEREERARQREEAQAQKELALAKAKQQKEVDHYRGLISQLITAGDVEAIDRAEQALAAAEEKLADVESTMANIRAGYVYVISNRGSFGDSVVKIGMTRRLNPEERVRELGDASVPFYFDKHAMIFARDAVGLERELHRRFAAQRVNLVNMRREYFYVTPHEVKEALMDCDQQYGAQLVDFHEDLDAPEFLASEEMRSSGTIPSIRAD